MQQNYESVNAMTARCMDTSSRLREFLFSGLEMAWTVRRDIATAANLLVDLSIALEEGEQGNDDTAKLLDNTMAIGRWHHERAAVAES